MNNSFQISKNDAILLINNIKQDLGKCDSLSQKERKILKVAIERLKKGEEAVIPSEIVNKLSQPTAYEQSIFDLIGDAVETVFSLEYISSQELSQCLNDLYLDADEMEHEIELLEAEVRKLEEPEVIESAGIDKVPIEKLHTVNEAHRVMWKLLGNAKAVEGTGEIIIVGQVLNDGRGDWAAMRNMYKVLSKKFPNRPIRVIANSDKRWDGKLDMTGITHCHLVYTENMKETAAYVPLTAFDEKDEIVKKVKEASILISAGIGMETVFEPIKEGINEKYIKMYEQDMQVQPRGEKEMGDTIIQAGVGIEDDRMGIFTKSNEKEYKWSDLSNPNLLSVLFHSVQPNENAIKSYLNSHVCFFGYVFSAHSKHVFMQDVFKYAKAHFPDKIVDICMPGSCDRGMFPLKNWENGMRFSINDSLQFKEGYDVGKVHLIWFEEGEKQERTIVLKDNIAAGAKKEIRLIDPGSISSRDFKIMTKISAPLVGCTGDNSLAQTLSYGKIPFYEDRFPSKRCALIFKIQEQQGYGSALYQYCRNLESTDGYRDRTLVNKNRVTKKGLEEAAKKFGEYIQKEANLKPILKGVVNEKLLRQEDPDFAKKQDELMQQYLEGVISSGELSTQFTALLAEKGLL